MRTLFLMAVLLLSSAASAQVQFRFGTAKTETLRFGKNSCQGAVTVTWTRTSNQQPCAGLTLWLTNATSCGTAIGTGDVSLSEVPQTTFQTTATGTFTFDTSVLPFAASTTDAGTTGTCGTLAEEKTFLLCGTTRQVEGFYNACGSTVVSATSGKVIYDGKPPAAPTVTSAVGLDSAVLVALTATSDALRGTVRLYLNGEEVRSVPWTSGQAPVQIDNLQNDTTYQVSATVFDEAENESDASARVDVTPTKTYGYMELYRIKGGQETGGCGATGGGIVGGALLAALGFWLFSRRDRSWLEQ